MAAVVLSDPVGVWSGNALGAALNVISNLFLLPMIVLAISRRDNAAFIVYTFVFTASVAYHSCRAGFVCATSLYAHQMLDYANVYSGMIFSLTRIPAQDAYTHFTCYLFFYGPVLAAVISEASQVIVVLLGLVFPLATSIFMYFTSHKLRKRRKLFRKAGWSIAAFVMFAIAGAFMFLFDDEDYWIAHPIWHAFSMLGGFCAEYGSYYHGIGYRTR